MKTEEAIASRKTLKVRANPEKPFSLQKDASFKKEIEELIRLAGNAPFHYESDAHHRSEGKLKGSEPWRFHALDGESCRDLLVSLNEDKPLKSSMGIKQMLAAADALILVTWLPEQTSRLQRNAFYPNVKNMEHIAATGAAIQNLLLAATSKGITNYWSSGGSLRKPKMLEALGIPDDEILLGAVFLFPDEFDEEVVEIKLGKNRDKRGPMKDWMNWVSL